VGGGINVDIVEITVDVWQRHQALVHDFEPEPGQVGEHVHAKVTIGKARQVFKMAQGLIAPQWESMVIRMTLKVKQNEV